MEKKRKIIAILAITIMIALFGVMSYAFFTVNVDNSNRTEAQLKTGTMALTFKDNDSTINERLMFGESVTKKFTIENTGTLETSLSLDWYDLVNTYTLGSLTYKLEYSDTESGEYQILVDTTNIPVTSEAFTLPVTSEISVPAGATYYYNLTITLENLPDVDQSDDLDAIFQTKFIVDQPSKYRYYTLVVDPGDGTWDSMTGVQSYQLMNNETIDMPEPTRVGYTFTGWSITSVAGDLSNETYSMGISNAKLVANWDINTYTLTIDSAGGTYSGDTSVELEYNTSTEISTPTREGYTFTGWTVSSGNLSGSNYTIGASDATLTATWQINDYKYIVYHYQQSIDGSEYTLVSADTDEGEATYNTTVTPDRKTYTGFTSPSGKSLTIKAETTYPPVLNKVDYEYARNKYTLTVDVGNGTYTGEAIPNNGIYYQSSVNLGTPTNPTGYSFTSWAVTNGTVTDNIYTMSNAENDTVTANYTPNEYAITFNANGGTVDTQSKTITYDSTYGTLPTPEYPSKTGVEFAGWFTEVSGGNQVTSTTKVSITESTTLYAQWTIPTFNIVQAVNAIQNGTTPNGVNTGTPNFGKVATTDEGVYAMEDNYGMSYYYRGAVENNYVKFGKWADNTADVYYGYEGTTLYDPKKYASLEVCENADSYNQNCTLISNSGKDMYWRIIRVNGDGSVRMIYDGTEAHLNGDAAVSRTAIVAARQNSSSHDVKYTGYMFGGSNGVNSTSIVEAQTNQTSSTQKTTIETWFSTHLADNYMQYLTDVIFCNSREIEQDLENANSGYYSDYTTLGYGKNATLFNITARLGIKVSNPVPELKCRSVNIEGLNENNDWFTKDATVTNLGNGDLDYPVGSISGDEIVLAGGKFGTKNQKYYLYKNATYWAMSPHIANTSGYGYSLLVNEFGAFGSDNVYGSYSVAPVINLSAESAATLIGDGTIGNEYRLPETE